VRAARPRRRRRRPKSARTRAAGRREARLIPPPVPPGPRRRRRLRCLTLRGGKFTPAAAALLLRGLAVACPALEELHLLPDALCGLGDDEMPLLVALSGLKVGAPGGGVRASSSGGGVRALPAPCLRATRFCPPNHARTPALPISPTPPSQRLEFQSYGLTGAGLLQLTALPQLEVGRGRERPAFTLRLAAAD
jgi:hypothetical protein